MNEKSGIVFHDFRLICFKNKRFHFINKAMFVLIKNFKLQILGIKNLSKVEYLSETRGSIKILNLTITQLNSELMFVLRDTFITKYHKIG